PEAVKVVAEKLGIALPKQAPSSPAEAKEAQLRAKLLDLHERAAMFFEEQLRKPEGARAREYLAGRGLTDETIQRFRIGYAPETAIYSKSRVLFNLDRAREAIRKLDYAILVEGQMDCISVDAAGFHNVIASSGTAFTEPQARLLGRYSKNVIVNFDPDAAGAAPVERSLALLVSEDPRIKVLTLEC